MAEASGQYPTGLNLRNMEQDMIDANKGVRDAAGKAAEEQQDALEEAIDESAEMVEQSEEDRAAVIAGDRSESGIAAERAERAGKTSVRATKTAKVSRETSEAK